MDHRRQTHGVAVEVVGAHQHAVRLRHGGDLTHYLDTADADVGVDDLGRVLFKHGDERFLVVQRLAGDDRGLDAGVCLGDQVDVVCQARLLDPEGVEFLDPLGEVDGVVGRQTAVDLHQQVHVGTHGLAHGLHAIHGVVLLRGGDVVAPVALEGIPLHGGEALGLHGQRPLHRLVDALGAAPPAVGVQADLLAAGAAQQVVHRLAADLTGDVPHGDLDGAPGGVEVAAAAADGEVVEHSRAGVLDLKGAAADHIGLHGLDVQLHRLFLALHHIGLAPAVHALIGVHAAEHQVLGTGKKGIGSNFRDFHCFSS